MLYFPEFTLNFLELMLDFLEIVLQIYVAERGTGDEFFRPYRIGKFRVASDAAVRNK